MILLLISPPKEGLLQAFRAVNWTSVGLAFTILGIEVGYLLAYRVGWSLNVSALIVTSSVTVLLIPLGMLIFAEKLSIQRILGIIVCAFGLVLLNWK